MQSQDTLTGTAFVFPYPSGLPQMQESEGPRAHPDEYWLRAGPHLQLHGPSWSCTMAGVGGWGVQGSESHSSTLDTFLWEGPVLPLTTSC